MTDFVFPLVRQERLFRVYPAIVGRIYATVQDAVILGLSRLLDTTRNSLTIHFKKFIDTAQKIPLTQIKYQSQWDEFLNKSNSFLGELPSLKLKLNPLRNKSLVHLSPALPDPQEITSWDYWSGVLERMENVYSLYQMIVRDAQTTPFWSVNLRDEPKSFLEWCRLDDFEKHRNLERERKLQGQIP